MTDLVMHRRIAAPRETVFAFLVERDKLLRWLGVSAEIDPREGGDLRIDVTGGDIVEGRFVEITPPERVVFTWGWVGNDDVAPSSTTVAFDLRADGDETLLVLTHSGLPEGEDDNHATGWTYFFDRLRVVAGGDDPGPISTADLGATTPSLREDP